MAHRSHEGPMDFEYQNGTGPIDARSPFARLSMNQQRAAGNANGPAASAKKRGVSAPAAESRPVLTGPRGIFASYGSSSKPATFAGLKAANLSTPRKLDLDTASSGGDTPQSPDRTAIDSDATPDNINTISFRTSPVKFIQPSGMPMFTAGDEKQDATALASPSKRPARRESWFSRGWDYFGSPGRSGEATRAGQNDSKLRKVMRKRADRSHRQLARLRDDGDSESDSDAIEHRRTRTLSPRKRSRSDRELAGPDAEPRPPSPPSTGTGYIAHISSFFEFLARHPTLPAILSWYAQLTLNIFVFTGIMWVLWSFWSTIRSDVDKKSSEAISELMAEMAVCTKQWRDNKCGPDTRVPAMEVVCNNWEKCMKRDVMSVGRAKVSAHTFAEIFNSFLEPISYKAMIFSLVLVFGCVALSNLPFSMFRDRAAAAASQSATGTGPNSAQGAQNHHHYYPPPTPGGRQASGSHEPAMQTWTPHGAGVPDYPYVDPQAMARQTIEPGSVGMRFGNIEGRGSPVKQLQFR